MVYLQNVLAWAAIFLVSATLFAENTSLVDRKDILVYEEVTSKVRCICLPSLPIKSCSYNNCSISAYIKVFIENRIRKGEDVKTILYKMEHGFGEEILNDPVVARFVTDGNQQIVESLVYGFGPKILAEPDSTFIDLTIVLVSILSILLIFYYLKKNRKISRTIVAEKNQQNSLADKYLDELNEDQR